MRTDESRLNIIKSVAPLITKRGIKGVTMDSVAKSLGISKRTLYEIFESKDSMIIETFGYMHDHYRSRMDSTLSNVENVMEGMILAFRVHLDILSSINVALFRDMDEYYPQFRPKFEKGVENVLNGMHKAFELGVEQGVFRQNVNYRIVMRLFIIQMESLKRMENIFPKDVTLPEIYNTMSTAFLRGIATSKGLEILEGLTEGHFTETQDNNSTEQKIQE